MQPSTFHLIGRSKLALAAALLAASGGPAFAGVAADLAVAVAVTPDARLALIAHRDTDNVTFFDVGQYAIVGAIDVGDAPMDVVVSPNGRYALVANSGSDDLTLINVHARRAVRQIPLSISEPRRIRISADGSRVVVGGAPLVGDWSFAVLDPAAGFQERAAFQTSIYCFQAYTGLVGGGSVVGSTGFAVTNDGSRMIVSDRIDAEVYVFDTASGANLVTLPYPKTGSVFGPSPLNVVMHPFGRFAVFADSDGVSALDLETLEFLGPYVVSGSSSYSSVEILRDGRTVAVSGGSSGVSFVNLLTGATERVGGISLGVELTGDGRYLFSNGPSASEIIDAQLRTVVATVPGVSTLSPEYYPVIASGEVGTNIVFIDGGLEQVGIVNASGAGASLGPLVATELSE